MMHSLGNRRLLVTMKGYLGIASKEVQVGDFVCLLFGGRLPVFAEDEPDVFGGSRMGAVYAI